MRTRLLFVVMLLAAFLAACGNRSNWTVVHVAVLDPCGSLIVGDAPGHLGGGKDALFRKAPNCPELPRDFSLASSAGWVKRLALAAWEVNLPSGSPAEIRLDVVSVDAPANRVWRGEQKINIGAERISALVQLKEEVQ